MARARVEGHIAIYESVKVIPVVGVALSLSFSSPLPPLASHSFVARRSSRPLSSSPSSSTSIWSSSKPSSSSSPSPPHSSSSHVARRGRCRRRRPRRYHPLFAIVKLIIRSLFCALLLLLLPFIIIFAVHRRRPHHYIDSACARDCFALPNSFAVIAPPALIIDNIDSVCGSKLKDFAVRRRGKFSHRQTHRRRMKRSRPERGKF